MKVTVQFEMDDHTAKLFMQSAIERVINTSTRIIDNYGEIEVNHFEDKDQNLEDWQEWKPIVLTLWNAMHDAVYRNRAGVVANTQPYVLRKGDL